MKFKRLTAVLAAAVLSFSTVVASADTVNLEEDCETHAFETGSSVSTLSTVTYDRKSKILPLTQAYYGECATTCAGMCVKKTRAQLVADGFNMQWANWEGIGSEYGYTVDWLGRADLSGKDALKVVYDYLKSGYPVCVWINQDDPHWVVVYRYSGNGTNFNASDFMCIDPARGWTEITRDRSLDSAYNYAGVYNTVVFK